MITLSEAQAVEALGYISAELANRSGAWDGEAPDWFPQPPEWLELWQTALKAVGALGNDDNGNLEQALSHLLNSHSVDNESDTPDFVLAGYLRHCLETWNLAVRARDEWYGFVPWEGIKEGHVSAAILPLEERP